MDPKIWTAGIMRIMCDPSSVANAAETNMLNNTAFKNFFNIITSAAAFDFKINPNPKAPTEPFGVEIVKQNLPREAEIELVFNKALDKRLMVNAKGLVKGKDPLLDRESKPLGDKYYEVLEKEIGHVRYRMKRERAMLAEIVSPKGAPLPVKILVTMPENVEVKENMLLIINTLGTKGEPVGGLTLNVIKRKALAK